ncbi:MAG: SPOR domain-containing protein [Bacteroidales bacterium]|nr:SPOR domain-containing protein [Bacteroidales bacterium]
MKRLFKLKFILLILGGSLFWQGYAQNQIPEDFCISSDELKLYNLINNYRKANQLPEIPLSENLCYVAKLHVSDLNYNQPDTGQCNLHSWSDQGHWVECCYGRDKFNNTCMTSKPKELTAYQGKGYEIAFWESVNAIPEIVLDLWKSSSASNDLILNRDIWQDKSWNAFGVGILKGYAVVWFGVENDSKQGVKVCTTGKMAGRLIDKAKALDEAGKAAGPRYYLVISSFSDEQAAKAEVAKYKTRGFRNPSVVKSGGNFRVSIGNYPSQDEALKAKESLGEKYKDAWIMKQ